MGHSEHIQQRCASRIQSEKKKISLITFNLPGKEKEIIVSADNSKSEN